MRRHAIEPGSAAAWVALAIVLAGIVVAVTSGAATALIAGVTYTGAG
jgi:hypothetical protein